MSQGKRSQKGNYKGDRIKINIIKHMLSIKIIIFLVRVKGLEPPRFAAPEPKSGASTNSATPALRRFQGDTRSLSKENRLGET